MNFFTSAYLGSSEPNSLLLFRSLNLTSGSFKISSLSSSNVLVSKALRYLRSITKPVSARAFKNTPILDDSAYLLNAFLKNSALLLSLATIKVRSL